MTDLDEAALPVGEHGELVGQCQQAAGWLDASATVIEKGFFPNVDSKSFLAGMRDGAERSRNAATAIETLEKQNERQREIIEGLYAGERVLTDAHTQARAEADRLRAALNDIARSGPVDQDGNPDAGAGWAWCYERARAEIDGSG